MITNNKKLAFSNRGGGAVSIAYLGFEFEFNKMGRRPDIIYAQSGSAIVECMKIAFPDWREDPYPLLDKFQSLRMWKFITGQVRKQGGIVSNYKLNKYLSEMTNGADISECEIPVIIGSSDLTDPDEPKPLLSMTGDLALLTTATTTIPPMKQFVEYKGMRLCDGAFTNVYAAKRLRELGAETIIGFYPHSAAHTPVPKVLKDLRALMVSQLYYLHKLENQNHPIDIEIDFKKFGYSMNDFRKTRELFELGRKLGREHFELL